MNIRFGTSLLLLVLVQSLLVSAHAGDDEATVQRAQAIAVEAAAKQRTLSQWLEDQLPKNCAVNESDLKAIQYINAHLADFAKYVQAPADFNHVLPGDPKAEPLSLRAFRCELTDSNSYSWTPTYVRLQLVPPTLRVSAKDPRGFVAFAASREPNERALGVAAVDRILQSYPDALDLSLKVDRQAIDTVLKHEPSMLTRERTSALIDLVGTLYARPQWASALPPLKAMRITQYSPFDSQRVTRPADWAVFCYSVPGLLRGRGCGFGQLETWYAEGQLDPNLVFELASLAKKSFKGSAIHAFALGLNSRYWTNDKGHVDRPNGGDVARHFSKLQQITSSKTLLAGQFNLIKLMLDRENIFAPIYGEPYPSSGPPVAALQKLAESGYPFALADAYNERPYVRTPSMGAQGEVNTPYSYFRQLGDNETLIHSIVATLAPDVTLGDEWKLPPLSGTSAQSFFYNAYNSLPTRKAALLWARLLRERLPARAEEIEVRAASELIQYLDEISDVQSVYGALGSSKLSVTAKARFFVKALALKQDGAAFARQLWEQEGLRQYGFRLLSNFTSTTPPQRFEGAQAYDLDLLALGAEPLEPLIPGVARSRYLDIAFRSLTERNYAAFFAALSKQGIFAMLAQDDLEGLVLSSTPSNEVGRARFIQDLEAASGKRFDMDGLNAAGAFRLFDFYDREICELNQPEIVSARLKDVRLQDRGGNTIAQALQNRCGFIAQGALVQFAQAGVDLASKNLLNQDLLSRLVDHGLANTQMSDEYWKAYVQLANFLIGARAFDPSARIGGPGSLTSFAAIVYKRSPIRQTAVFEAFYARAVELGQDPTLSLDTWFFDPKREPLYSLPLDWLSARKIRVDGDWLLSLADRGVPDELSPALFALNYDASRVSASSGRNAIFALIDRYARAGGYDSDFRNYGAQLIAHGADPLLKDRSGLTPLDYARGLPSLREQYLSDVYLWTHSRLR